MLLLIWRGVTEGDGMYANCTAGVNCQRDEPRADVSQLSLGKIIKQRDTHK